MVDIIKRLATKSVEVNAKTEAEAIDYAKNLYSSGEIAFEAEKPQDLNFVARPIMKYGIEITEAYSKIITVEALSESEAIKQVQDRYKNSEIILDNDNFVDYDIGVFARGE
ncbi:hypothetical protein FACS1894216_20040 [Synergistales bacterium]|nr:hypothetical protein FACS1894216_20040 [Synergistales bacterium]